MLRRARAWTGTDPPGWRGAKVARLFIYLKAMGWADVHRGINSSIDTSGCASFTLSSL